MTADPVFLVEDFEIDDRNAPSLDEILERLMRCFTHPDAPKSQHREVLPLELAVSSGQARTGGTIAVAIPVFGACAACHGAGHLGFFPCRLCDGRGVVAEPQ